MLTSGSRLPVWVVPPGGLCVVWRPLVVGEEANAVGANLSHTLQAECVQIIEYYLSL